MKEVSFALNQRLRQGVVSALVFTAIGMIKSIVLIIMFGIDRKVRIDSGV